MARSFNGSSDFIQWSNITTGNAAGWSGGFWVKLNSLPTVSGYVGLINAVAGTNEFDFYLKGSGGFALYSGIGNFTFNSDPWTTLTVSTGTWHHIAFTSPGAGNAYLYVDGVQSSPTANTLGGLTPISALYFGEDYKISGRVLDGAAADLFFIDTELTPIEVAALSSGVRPRSIRRTGKAFEWWPLDGLASPEPDLGGNNTNGALTGTTLTFGPPIKPITPRGPQDMTARAPAFILPSAAGDRIFRVHRPLWC